MNRINAPIKTTPQTPKATVIKVNIAVGPDLAFSGAAGFVADMLVVATEAGAIVVATVAGAVVVDGSVAIAAVDEAFFDKAFVDTCFDTTLVDTTSVGATDVVFTGNSVTAAPETVEDANNVSRKKYKRAI